VHLDQQHHTAMSDPQINPETGEAIVERSPRFIHWVAFLVFSVITLGSAVQVVSSMCQSWMDGRPLVGVLIRYANAHEMVDSVSFMLSM
jgi:hypothetical protein